MLKAHALATALAAAVKIALSVTVGELCSLGIENRMPFFNAFQKPYIL
jgi:hypothetical protein